MVYHRLPAPVFRSIALGGADETGALPAGQLSKRLLLLHAVRRRLETLDSDALPPDVLAANWSGLTRARHADSTEVDRLLLYPPIGTWGMRLLHRLQRSEPLDDSDLDDIGYLGGLATVALMSAQLPGETVIRVRSDGTSSFPRLGRFGSLGEPRWLTATVVPDRGLVRLREERTIIAVAGDDPRWSAVRQLQSNSAGQRLVVTLDDIDPYRSPEEVPSDERLADVAVARWQTCLDEAWNILVKHHPTRAAAISRDITSLTPLRSTAREPQLSASSGESFGGIALTTPRHGEGMAEALVHEHQHIKLWALLALVPLVDSADERLFYAPWRADPRPAGGLLQGAYAFFGLVDFWEVERHRRRGVLGRMAHFDFARWRGAVDEALRTLEDAGVLTDTGRVFVADMRSALAPLLAAPVPTPMTELAEEADLEARLGWRLRNLPVSRRDLDALVRAWRDGRSCPPDAVRSGAPRPGSRGSRPTGRQWLARERLIADDETFDDVRTPSPGPQPADYAFARGDHTLAARLYAESVSSPTAPFDSWTGLALAHARAHSAAAGALVTYPEVVRALWDALQPEAPPPESLAEWVAKGLDRRRLDH
ncbi:HEXXH motif domain-containing protein [Cryptosporangium japonicum]|uniref:HEXXH motif domain-containing protein n=1 Tax=Cryptosporangium japonicum TaxID=80872 RepID=A0ABN0TTE6_9ACTN